MICQCDGNPLNSADWHGRKLLDRDMIHGHTLDLGDLNGDGNLDILTAEQGRWKRGPEELDNPDATAWAATRVANAFKFGAQGTARRPRGRLARLVRR